jgi:uncharacterized membrane protein
VDALAVESSRPKEERSAVRALIAVTYPDEHRAAEVLAALHRLRAPGPPGPEDAAVVTRRLDARITLHQSRDLSGAGVTHGELWAALVALLVSAPPQAGGGGDPVAALQRLERLGVGEAFAVRLSACLPPASSAVWLVVDDASLAGVLGQLRLFGGTELQTPLAG